MSKMLKFMAADVIRLLDHTEQAQVQGLTPDDLANPEMWLPGTTPGEYGLASEDQIDRSRIGPRLFFVHDSGVYLMSGGSPTLLEPDNKPGETRSVVAYAEGLGPDADYDDMVSAVGGDDFGIPIASTYFRNALKQNPSAKTLTMKVSRNAIQFGAR